MKILLIRLCAVGDVVRVMGAAQAMRTILPDATIDFAVARMASDVVEGHEAIDHVMVWDSPKNRLLLPFCVARYLWTIRKERYDVALDFHGVDWRGGMVMAATGARLRIGFPLWRCRRLSYLWV